jgi:hypothetical protein
MRSSSTLDMKVGYHIIQVTQFKYFGSIVQNDEEIKADVNHRIQVGWLKWTRASSILCDTKVSFKLKEKLSNNCQTNDVLWNRVLDG